jgi:phage-related minor tail protein
MTTRDYVFRLRGEADQLVQAHERAAVAAERHALNTANLALTHARAKGAAETYAGTLARQSDQLARTGKLSTSQLQQVGFQLNDLAVQVASGQNPLLALVQQGSQLSGTFGGVRPALSAVATLATPAALGIGAVAGGVLALSAAFIQNTREQRAFENSLAATGNRAGLTRTSFDGITDSVQRNAQVTIGSAREITKALVDSGQVGAKALAPLAETGALLVDRMGKGASEATALLVQLAREPSKAAAELNKTYNFLTVEQFKYLQQLEQQGQASDAAAEASRLFNVQLRKIEPTLDALQVGLRAVKMAASSMWEALAPGRQKTPDELAQATIASLAEAERRLEVARSKGPNNAPDVRRKEEGVERLRAQLENFRLAARAERDVARGRADDAARTEAEITKIQRDGAKARRDTKKKEDTGPAFNASLDRIEDDLARRVVENRDAFQRDLEERGESALRAVEQQALTNQALSVALMTDDRARGERHIELEAEQLRKRIDLTVLAADERKAAEESVAQFIALRQQQLNDQLKPQYQRLLENWADTTAQMRETGDRFMTGFLQQGEQTWLELNRSGKLSLSSLGDLLRDELARLSYRQFIAPTVASIGKSIAGAVGFTVPGAPADLGLAASKAAEKVATDAAAGALVAFTFATKAATGAMNAAALTSPGGGGDSGLGGFLGSLFGGFELGGGTVHPSTVGSGFAKGGAFVNTIVTEPTPFRFARGAALGEMGEAGPEGIFPLLRDSKGRLGVSGQSGGAAPYVNVRVNIVGAPSQPQIRQRRDANGGIDIDVLFEQFRDRLGNEIDNGGGLLRNITGRTGGNGSAGLTQ